MPGGFAWPGLSYDQPPPGGAGVGGSAVTHDKSCGASTQMCGRQLRAGATCMKRAGGMQASGELESCHLRTSQNDRTEQGQVRHPVSGPL